MTNPVDEVVHLSDHDPRWSSDFEAERSRIQTRLDLHVEHIGSSAVPGLIAKPVLDIQLGVLTYPVTAETIGALEGLGYENLGECGVPGRLYFRRRGSRSFNIHLVEYAGEHWSNNIALREYLRRSESARSTYAQAKRDAIAKGANRLLSYSEAKANVVSSLLAKARVAQRAG
jgi:GrpB-like predicted nucleotidyltransferase (UPF0157 family)